MEKHTVTRRNEILKLLSKDESLKTSDMAEIFGVTTETIRKDLLYLQDKGVVQKLHGKAKLSRTSSDTPIDIRTLQMQNEKIKIAECALEMVENNSTIFIDGGSTTLEIAKLLSKRDGMIVITTSLSAANIIARQNNTVYIASGFVEGPSMIINGPFLFESIAQFKPIISFMGTNGVLYHQGPTSKNYNDIDAKNAIIKNSTKAVVVCDSSKFHESGMLQYAKWEEIDTIITDAGIPEDIKAYLENLTKVVITDPLDENI